MVGGAQVFVAQAIDAVLTHGAQAGLIVGGSGFLTERLKESCIPIWTVPTLTRFDPWSMYRSYRAARRIISDFRPDVVSAHSSMAGAVVRLAADREAVARVVYRDHGWPFREGSAPWRRPWVFVERYLGSRTDEIVSVSGHERNLAIRHRIAGAAKVRVVHNGILADSQFRASPPSGGEARLLFVGRLVEDKDPLLFVNAVAAAATRGLQLRASIAGNGPLRETVEEAITARGLSDRVDLLGEVPYEAIPGLMSNHHVLVATSRREALGRMALEAMSVGLPVVSVAVGGLPELVKDRVTGLLVNGREPDDLARAVQTLVRDRRLWAATSDAGPKIVRERFDVNAVMEQYWAALTGQRASAEDRENVSHRATSGRPTSV